jgi:hypothetical protein
MLDASQVIPSFKPTIEVNSLPKVSFRIHHVHHILIPSQIPNHPSTHQSSSNQQLQKEDPLQLVMDLQAPKHPNPQKLPALLTAEVYPHRIKSSRNPALLHARHVCPSPLTLTSLKIFLTTSSTQTFISYSKPLPPLRPVLQNRTNST